MVTMFQVLLPRVSNPPTLILSEETALPSSMVTSALEVSESEEPTLAVPTELPGFNAPEIEVAPLMVRLPLNVVRFAEVVPPIETVPVPVPEPEELLTFNVPALVPRTVPPV